MENQANTQTSTQTSNQSNVRKNVNEGGINISRVYKGNYNKADEETAELKQVVTTKSYYPTKQVRNDKQDNVYGLDDFSGGGEKEFTNKETRVAWITVPKGETPEKVAEKIAQFPQARLYRVLANKPILTSGQKAAIASPDLEATKDMFAERQAVRNPQDNTLVLDKNGKIQYRSIYFSTQGNEDQDLRTADPSDFWASAALNEEMNGGEHIVPDQEI